jgi:hypothetical protein
MGCLPAWLHLLSLPFQYQHITLFVSRLHEYCRERDVLPEDAIETGLGVDHFTA